MAELTDQQQKEKNEPSTTAGPAEQATLRELRMRKRSEKGALRRAIRGATTDDPVLGQAAEALEGTRGEIAGLRGRKQAARRVLRGTGKASALQPKAEAEAPAAEKKEEPKSPAAQSKARTAKAASAAMGAASQPKPKPKPAPPPRTTDEFGMPADSETDVDAIIDAAAPPQSMREEVEVDKVYADEYDAAEPQSVEEDMVTPPAPIPEVPVTDRETRVALEIRLPQFLKDNKIVKPDNVRADDFEAATRAAYRSIMGTSGINRHRRFHAELERLLGTRVPFAAAAARTTASGFADLTDEEREANRKALQQAATLRGR